MTEKEQILLQIVNSFEKWKVARAFVTRDMSEKKLGGETLLEHVLAINRISITVWESVGDNQEEYATILKNNKNLLQALVENYDFYIDTYFKDPKATVHESFNFLGQTFFKIQIIRPLAIKKLEEKLSFQFKSNQDILRAAISDLGNCQDIGRWVEILNGVKDDYTQRTPRNWFHVHCSSFCCGFFSEKRNNPDEISTNKIIDGINQRLTWTAVDIDVLARLDQAAEDADMNFRGSIIETPTVGTMSLRSSMSSNAS